MGQRNSNQISKSKELIEENKFEVDQLKEQVKKLNEDMKKLTQELEDTRNRGMRKTLIFKNIPHDKKESWEETKFILAKEINKFMPQYQLEHITSKIERAHRARETKFTEVPAIIAKSNDWSITETVKSSFIKGNSSIFVSQMFSPALTARRNAAMLARKNLKKDDPTIQAFVKYPAKLMVKKEGEKGYSLYAEY